MKCVDMSRHAVVRCGLAWPHAQLPSTKDMIPRLERNEAYVSWMQPHGGRVDDMFPAIRIEGHFYTLSLRMMKAVWRHVRLKKGFVNREAVPHVGTLLRIPTVLLMEKIRTQERFNVSTARAARHATINVAPRCRSCGPRRNRGPRRAGVSGSGTCTGS
jgi:hypothetical protein